MGQDSFRRFLGKTERKTSHDSEQESNMNK